MGGNSTSGELFNLNDLCVELLQSFCSFSTGNSSCFARLSMTGTLSYYKSAPSCFADQARCPSALWTISQNLRTKKGHRFDGTVFASLKTTTGEPWRSPPVQSRREAALAVLFISIAIQGWRRPSGLRRI